MYTTGEQMVVCVRLILEEGAVAGANAIAYRHYGSQTLPTIAHTTTPYYGVASFIFYVGPGSPGRPNAVEAIVSYQGTTYRAVAYP
jgi:hypothetical protein